MTADELHPLAQQLIDAMAAQGISTEGKYIAIPPALCNTETAAQLQERVGVQVVVDAEMPLDQISLTEDQPSQEEIEAHWAKMFSWL